MDGGATIRVATRPSYGRRAAARRWANAARRLAGVALACDVRVLNGEPAVVIRLPDAGMIFATVHVETRDGLVTALRVMCAPERLAAVAPTVH